MDDKYRIGRNEVRDKRKTSVSTKFQVVSERWKILEYDKTEK